MQGDGGKAEISEQDGGTHRIRAGGTEDDETVAAQLIQQPYQIRVLQQISSSFICSKRISFLTTKIIIAFFICLENFPLTKRNG